LSKPYACLETIGSSSDLERLCMHCDERGLDPSQAYGAVTEQESTCTYLYFDLMGDLDVTGGRDVWYAKPLLFFNCTLCPTGSMSDTTSYKDVSLKFTGLLQHL
jgi:hypothetical protein